MIQIKNNLKYQLDSFHVNKFFEYKNGEACCPLNAACNVLPYK